MTPEQLARRYFAAVVAQSESSGYTVGGGGMYARGRTFDSLKPENQAALIAAAAAVLAEESA